MLFEYLLLILAYLTATVSADAGYFESSFPWGAVFAACALVLSMGLSSLVSLSLVRRIKSWKGEWADLVNTHGRTLILHQLALLALFAGATHAGGWGAFVGDTLGLATVPFAREGVILLPYGLAWLWSLRALYMIEGGETRFGAYFLFRARAAMGLLGFLLVAGGLFEVFLDAGEAGRIFRANPLAEAGVGAGLVALGVLFMPIALRILWTTRPLEEGKIRDALAQFSARVGFRFGSIRIWETGGLTVLNAAVAGLLPRLRTVFLTRGLLENLEEEQIVSVFAHEVGHVKGNHGWLALQLAVGWGGAVLAVEGGFLSVGGEAAGLAVQAALSLFFALVYVLLSRRMERAADLYAVDAMGGPESVASTLQRVAMLNGDTRSMRSLTHMSIERRVELMKRTADDPVERSRFGRQNLFWSGLTTVFMVMGIAAVVPRFV